MKRLQEEGLPCGPVLDPRDTYNDPQFKQRDFFEKVTQDESGTHLYPGMFFKLSKTPLSIRKPAVCLGEHNEYVYKEILKVTDEEYEQLAKEGHIGMDYIPEIV